MDVAEALVERYITRNGLTFACPQYTLRREFGGQRDFDFVVLDFKNKQIVLIEVSDSGGLGSLDDLDEFELVYLDKLHEQVATDTNEMTIEWEVGLLGFLRKSCVSIAYNKHKHISRRFFFQAIEDTVGDYWERRGERLIPALSKKIPPVATLTQR